MSDAVVVPLSSTMGGWGEVAVVIDRSMSDTMLQSSPAFSTR